MAVSSGGRKEISMEKRFLEREPIFHQGNRTWNTDTKPEETEVKVSIIYYLSRNNQLEHPHLMEVPISSPQGILSLKDIINRLNFLRGQGMASMYSWSAKRCYKNGFVWQDLSENDFIYPCNGHEYVLKGTQLIETSSPSLQLIETSSPSFRSYERISSPILKTSSETSSSSTDSDSPAAIIKRRNQVYMAKTCMEASGRFMNASTQTEDKWRKQRGIEKEEISEYEENYGETEFSENIEGSSLPFSSNSSSSNGGLEGSMKGYGSAHIRDQTEENGRPSGRMKASTVLTQLIRCGSSTRFEHREYVKQG